MLYLNRFLLPATPTILQNVVPFWKRKLWETSVYNREYIYPYPQCKTGEIYTKQIKQADKCLPDTRRVLTKLSSSGSSLKKGLPSFSWLRTKFSMSTSKLAEVMQSELSVDCSHFSKSRANRGNRGCLWKCVHAHADTKVTKQHLYFKGHEFITVIVHHFQNAQTLKKGVKVYKQRRYGHTSM